MLWLSMRFVDGADLRTLVARRPLAPARAARDRRAGRRRAGRRARAPARAPRRQARQRPARPRGDHAYLTDFGLVKALDETSGQTRTGDVVGTLDYVAPERIRGEGDGPPATSTRSAACCSSRSPGTVRSRSTGAERKLWAHLSEPPPPVPGHPAFDAVIARALAKDPARALRERRRAGRGGDRRRGRLAAGALLEAARRCERGDPRRAPARRSPRRGRGAAGRARARRRARAAAARGAGRHAAGADRAPAGRGPRGPGRRARRGSSPRSPGSSPCSAGCRRRWPPSTPRSSGSWSSSRPSRGRVLADDAGGRRAAGALQDELATLAERLAPRVGNPPPRVAIRRPRPARPFAPWRPSPTRCAARAGAATSRRTSSRRRCTTSSRGARRRAARPRSRSTACAPGTSPASTPTAR